MLLSRGLVFIGLLGGALGLVFYLDSRMNDAPQGGEFQWHIHLYDRSNPPPIGKPLPVEKFGYRGFYYVDSSSAQSPPVNINRVDNIPITSVEPKIIYRRPFRGRLTA
jgi:hypothetical protein